MQSSIKVFMGAGGSRQWPVRGTNVDEAQILVRLSEVAADHFDVPGVVLTRESTAADVEGWDSLAHIQFIMQIEKAFGIRFKSSEISGFADVGQLADRIKLRTAR